MSLVNIELNGLILQIKMTICNQYQSRLYNLNQLNRNQLCFLFYDYDIADDICQPQDQDYNPVPVSLMDRFSDHSHE